MKIKILKPLLFLSIICFLWSCSKKESNSSVPNVNPSAKGKLHYMIFSNNTNMEFLYDNSGRLITLNWNYLPNTRAVYSFIRNSAGQITRHIYEEPSYQHKETYDYSINNAGQYISAIITEVDNGNTKNSSEAYTYPGNHLTRIDRTKNGVLENTEVQTYDTYGNLSKCERYYASGSLEKYERTFDDKINPAGSLGAPTTLSNGFIFSVNNLLSENQTSNGSVKTTTASYSYDNSGKPISAIFTGYVEGGTVNIQYKYY